MSNILFENKQAYKIALNNEFFWGRYPVIGGGALSMVQFANPVGSTIKTYVSSLLISSTAALLLDVWKGTFISAAAPGNFIPKVSGAVAQTKLRSEATNAGAAGSIFYSANWAANETKELIFDPPFVLLPGESINVILPVSTATVFIFPEIREAA